MPALEEEIRRLMAEETAELHAPPDLAERVMRGARGRRTRSRIAALAASAAVLVAAPAGYLTLGSTATPAPEPTISMAPEPPPIDDFELPPAQPSSLGDLGDGREFGRVKVGYLPEGLRWSNWSLDYGDHYTTSYDFHSDENGIYCVQIYVYEDAALQEVDDRIQDYRDEGDGRDVKIGDRTGYLIIQHVGEDGMKGTPTLFLRMGDRQLAEITFSPTYAQEFPGEEAVEAELRKIAAGLTSTL